MYSYCSSKPYLTESDLASVFTFFLIECAVALAVLLPYSYHRQYWVKTLILQILFGGWLFFKFLISLHEGGLYLISVLGVFLINVLIFILLIASINADKRNKNRFENL